MIRYVIVFATARLIPKLAGVAGGALAARGSDEGAARGFRRPGAGRDPGRRARLAGQVALGQQLAVALLDKAAGDAELAGKRPRGRQPLADLQPAAPDRVAEPGLELRPERLVAPAVELEQQLRSQTGPLNSHETGPYQCSIWLLRSHV